MPSLLEGPIPPLLSFPGLDRDLTEHGPLSIQINYPLQAYEEETNNFEHVEASLIRANHGTRPLTIGSISFLISHDLQEDYWCFDAESSALTDFFVAVLNRLRREDRARLRDATFIFLDSVRIEPRFRGRGLGTAFISNVLYRIDLVGAFVALLPWPLDVSRTDADPRDVQRLRQYYQRFGFEDLWDTPFMYFAPWRLSAPLRRPRPIDL